MAVVAVEKWYRVNAIMSVTGMGRTFLYCEMEAGRLKSKKVGGARVVTESALAEWQARFNGAGEIEGGE